MLGARAGSAPVRTDRTVLLVGAVDRRILPAVGFLLSLPLADPRALHVAVDDAAASQLAMDWLAVGLEWLPLSIHEPDDEDLEVTVQNVIEREMSTATSVTVVIPELHFPRWWHPFLHHGHARRITRRLQEVRGVTSVLVPYALTME